MDMQELFTRNLDISTSTQISRRAPSWDFSVSASLGSHVFTHGARVSVRSARGGWFFSLFFGPRCSLSACITYCCRPLLLRIRPHCQLPSFIVILLMFRCRQSPCAWASSGLTYSAEGIPTAVPSRARGRGHTFGVSCCARYRGTSPCGFYFNISLPLGGTLSRKTPSLLCFESLELPCSVLLGCLRILWTAPPPARIRRDLAQISSGFVEYWAHSVSSSRFRHQTLSTRSKRYGFVPEVLQ